jgi:glycosyl transferase family 9 (putative heptosyltransferase)
VRVVVQARAELRALLGTAAGVADTVDVADRAPECDAELPLLSLAHRLRLGAADFDAGARYLRSDPSQSSMIAAVLARGAGTRRIGLAWAGAAHHANDRRRSMPLAALAPLLALPAITWYSLQKGARSVDVDDVPAARAVVPLASDSDFARTAALVDALDAVVTVDTSIAHLAGALGKPVFVLLPFAPDWRWGLAGRRTPWYPTARLVRQPALGDWSGAVAALLEELRESA